MLPSRRFQNFLRHFLTPCVIHIKVAMFFRILKGFGFFVKKARKINVTGKISSKLAGTLE